ncbi:MAG TPA: class I adenylate-forming enzyme family protein [Novosphingobium sp.]
MTADDLDQSQPLLDPSVPLFADLMAAAAERFPEQEAFVHKGERITYADWLDQALRVGAGLRKRGAAPGTIVLIGLENSIDFAVCFAAAQLIGAIASGVNTRLGRREIDSIVARSAASVMILEDEAPLPCSGPAFIRRSELAAMRREEEPAIPHKGQPSDHAIVIWTSGTTGAPKGASFTHNNLRCAVRTAGPLAAPFARKLGSVPFAHAGFMSKGWEQVAFGVTLVIAATPWSVDETLRLLVDERISIAGAVPTQWAKLVAHPGARKIDLSHLRVGISATAPASPELIAQVSAVFGVPLIVRYSMTECPSMTGTRTSDGPDVQFRTVGRPQPGVALRLLDAELRDVAPGSIGRIAVRSQTAMTGYWNDPERTDEVFTADGWLLSGDYGRFDDAGNLVLAGRTGEMYIRGGYNVYPIEIERVLAELPDIAAVAVVGTPAPVIGETGVAFVVPTDPALPPTLAALREKVRAELADYKAPDQLVVLEALPLTAMMKIDKAELKRLAAELKSTRG